MHRLQWQKLAALQLLSLFVSSSASHATADEDFKNYRNFRTYLGGNLTFNIEAGEFVNGKLSYRGTKIVPLGLRYLATLPDQSVCLGEYSPDRHTFTWKPTAPKWYWTSGRASIDRLQRQTLEQPYMVHNASNKAIKIYRVDMVKKVEEFKFDLAAGKLRIVKSFTPMVGDRFVVRNADREFLQMFWITSPQDRGYEFNNEPDLPEVRDYVNLSELAKDTAPKRNGTILWLNFDGLPLTPFEYSKEESDDIVMDYQVASLKVFYDNNFLSFPEDDAVPQDILFRVSEFFAPFDVVVARLSGPGTMDKSTNGNTTIFVGGKQKPNIPNSYGATPMRYSDFPRKHMWDGQKGTAPYLDHRINSDDYDMSVVVLDRGEMPEIENRDYEYWLAAVTAHEAGHTFGLPHTDESWGKDDTPGELMSPAKEGGIRRDWMCFMNKEFNIYDENSSEEDGEGVGMVNYKNREISRVNTFDYLTTALGKRRNKDDIANLAESKSADPAYKDGQSPTLVINKSRVSKIEYLGDYDVYELQATDNREIEFTVSDLSELLNPIVLVYEVHRFFNQRGLTRKGFVGENQRTSATLKVKVKVEKDKHYKVVVGAFDSATMGTYRISAKN